MRLVPPDALPLPLTAEEVTARWLTTALRQQRPGLSVTEATIVEVIKGTSTKIRVRLRCEGAGAEDVPPTLIVKGGFEEHSPQMAAMYANEVRFFADVQPWLPIPSPRCFFAGSDCASHQSIVIMEDLKRDGVTFCDPLKPQSFEQVAHRLEVMAGYHAASWDSPEFEPGGRWADIGSRFETWGMDYMRRYLEPETWSHSMAQPRGAAVSARFKDRGWMEQALTAIGDIQFRQPRCMIHGDTHLGNLYIDEAGGPGFLDAQVARTAWHHEVSYHIVCALDLADRRRCEAALLERYLLALAEHGVPAPDLEAAWLDYRRSIVWGLFIFLINEVRFQTEAVNTAYTARFSAAAVDHELQRQLG